MVHLYIYIFYLGGEWKGKVYEGIIGMFIYKAQGCQKFSMVSTFSPFYLPPASRYPWVFVSPFSFM